MGEARPPRVPEDLARLLSDHRPDRKLKTSEPLKQRRSGIHVPSRCQMLQQHESHQRQDRQGKQKVQHQGQKPLRAGPGTLQEDQ